MTTQSTVIAPSVSDITVSRVMFQRRSKSAFPSSYIVEIPMAEVGLEYSYAMKTPNLDRVIKAIESVITNSNSVDPASVKFMSPDSELGEINNVPKSMRNKEGGLIGTNFR